MQEKPTSSENIFRTTETTTAHVDKLKDSQVTQISEQTDVQKIETLLNGRIKKYTGTIVKWVSTVYTLTLPSDYINRLYSAVNMASQWVLQFNILKSVDGRTIRRERIVREKKQKKNKDNFPKEATKHVTTTTTTSRVRA